MLGLQKKQLTGELLKIMDRLATTAPGQRGSKSDIQQSNFTATYRGIKTGIVSVLMLLSVIGGALL